MTSDELYFELYELYKRRVKTKHLTLEGYNFERHSATKLQAVAEQIQNHSWNVSRYLPFKVFHPQRIINAPTYVDRIAEQWFVEKYIQQTFVPQLYEYNMACQEGKGPFLTMDLVKAAIEEMYYMYGTDWWVFQFDCEGYFDNISHSGAKDLMSKLDPEALWLYNKIVDSFYIDDCYASLNESSDGLEVEDFTMIFHLGDEFFTSRVVVTTFL